MGQDLLNKSLKKIDFVPKNANIRNLINESYYFGYKWKDRLGGLTNYTHSRPMYKLIVSDKSFILEKITTYVATHQFKIVNVDVYIYTRTINNDLQLTSDYQDNIGIVEQYMLDDANKHKISKYIFKILENGGIFSIMDSSYDIIKHDGIIESSQVDGYIKSTIRIASLLENFIVPS